MTKFFFKVEDNYQSFFDKTTGKPYQYVRKIDEGGYTKNQEGFFNQDKNTILVKDYKNKTENSFATPENVQDIISTFYFYLFFFIFFFFLYFLSILIMYIYCTFIHFIFILVFESSIVSFWFFHNCRKRNELK